MVVVFLAGEDFRLIYYPDPWPANGLICLDSGTVDKYENIHIKRLGKYRRLAIAGDANYPGGAKIFLFLRATWTVPAK